VYRSIFTAHIYDKEQFRQAFHIAQTTQASFETADFALDHQALFFRQTVDLTAVAHALEAFEFLDTLVNGDPIGNACRPASAR
jgi:hypothetical protein